jgi:hypothetical protein
MAFVTELSGLSDERRRKLYFGERLNPSPRIIIEDFKPGRFYDQLGAYTGILLVSNVLREVLLATAGASLQFIPVKMRDDSGLKYFIVNVLDTVPALDLERSGYDTFPGGGIESIHKLVLRRIPSNAPPIFHAAEHTTLILVNDELRRRLEKASKHPGVFIPTSKYSDGF